MQIESELRVQTILNEWVSKRVVNVQDGLDIENAHDLGDFFFQLFRVGVRRLPIIGTQSGVFILVVPEKEKPGHLTLLSELKKPKDIVFTTSIELFGLPDEEKPDKQWIHLEDKSGRYNGYVMMGNGSDALDKPFSIPGRNIMKDIFSKIEGVTLSWS